MKLNHLLKQYIAISLLFSCLACMSYANTEEKKTIIDSYTIELPQGEKMEFVFIKVSENSNVFSSFKFEMGRSLNAGYHYRQTTTTVGGSIFCINKAEKGATPYWAIPMAKTELTRGQYAAIMEEAKPENPNHPKTGLTKGQMIQFIERFNLWLHNTNDSSTSAVNVLLKACAHPVEITILDKRNERKVNILLHGSIYARLPNEAEWEFAARGGMNVSQGAFRQVQPYNSIEELSQSEVVAQQSEGTSQVVGSTGRTNPCGLFDMLGNVSEVVESRYCPSYLYGRMGGILLRGAYWATPLPSDKTISESSNHDWVSSYYRQEIPNIDKGKPYQSNRMGLRLVLGSDITGKYMRQVLDRDKELIGRQNHSKLGPHASPTDSLYESIGRNNLFITQAIRSMSSYFRDQAIQREKEDKTNEELASRNMSLQEKERLISQLTQQLSQRNSQINELTIQFQKIEDKIGDNKLFSTEAQEIMAQAGAELIIAATFFAIQSLEEIHRYNNVLSVDVGYGADEIAGLREKIQSLQKDVNNDWERFCKGCMALAKADVKAVEEEFARREQLLMKQKNNKADLLSFKLARKIYLNYKQQGSISNDERELWKSELKAIVELIRTEMGVN